MDVARVNQESAILMNVEAVLLSTELLVIKVKVLNYLEYMLFEHDELI